MILLVLLFRIGGDEFTVVTGYENIEDAKILAQRILAGNGATFEHEGQRIPLALYVGVARVPGDPLSYQEALAMVSSAIAEAKRDH